MANHLPYFPFYVNDFANDPVVESMSTEQVGAYLLLLCKAWRQKPPGTLPKDDTVLARWARLSPERWSEVRTGVLAAFCAGSDDRWHQKRMRQEFAKLAHISKSRSDAGRKGVEAKQLLKQSVSNCLSNREANCSVSESDSGSNFSSEKKDCEEVVRVARASPHAGQTWEVFLAQEWLFYYRGTAHSQRDLAILTPFFGALIDQGIACEDIEAAIRSKERPKTQPTWEFEKSFRRPVKAKAAETRAEMIARLRQCSDKTTTNGQHVTPPSSGSVSKRT